MATFADEYAALLGRAKEQGLTQAALSDAVGLHRVTLAQAGSRPQSIGWAPLVRLCEVVGVVGRAKRALLYAWIETKAERQPEVAALLRTVHELQRRLPVDQQDEVQQIVIDSWSAEEARYDRDEKRRKG